MPLCYLQLHITYVVKGRRNLIEILVVQKTIEKAARTQALGRLGYQPVMVVGPPGAARDVRQRSWDGTL